MKKGIEVIHVIGDSHVDVFSGLNSIQPEWPKLSHDVLPLFNTYRLGAILAYNLSKPGHPSNTKLRKLIAKLPKKAIILLVAGEVDCRVHLVHQSLAQNKPISQIVASCLEKYLQLLVFLKKRGYRVIVCGPIASTPFQIPDKTYPTVGSFTQRNKATKVFNNKLRQLAQKNGIAFISIYEDLWNGKRVNMSYFIDAIHVSTQALPLYYSQLSALPFVNKQLLAQSRKVQSPDLVLQTIKRKLLYFVLIQSKFYATAQKCKTYIEKLFR